MVLGQAAFTPAGAQNIGGVIDLMGRLIERDMRNEQIRREQRQYEAQQRAARAEQARREMALVKRLQTALQKLGFYNSKIDGDRGSGTRAAEQRFIMAFGFAPQELDEDVIAQIEALASTGFRSADEIRRAAALGYDTRQDLTDGEAGGFRAAAEFFEARQRGFSQADEYRRFRASGFSSPQAFRDAQIAGFTTSIEFERAKSKGFATKLEYDEFVQSGQPDRKTFLEKRELVAAKRHATEMCTGVVNEPNVDTATATLEFCLQAVSQGERSVALVNAVARIGKAIEQRLRSLEGSAAANGQTAVASTDAQSPAPGDFLAERTRLKDTLKIHNCAAAALVGNWRTALDNCEPLAAVFPTVAALRAQAAEAVAQDDKLIAEKAENERRVAEEERKRLALRAATARMGALIKDISEFTEAKRVLAKPMDVAKAFVTLKALEKSGDFEAIEQAILKIETLLKEEPDYAKFLAERAQAQDVARTNARATALSELQRVGKFIEDYISRNLLSASAADLLALQGKITQAVASGQDETIFNAQNNATAEIARLSLDKELAGFKIATDPVASTVEKASNGLAVTDGSRELLTGDARDVLLLGNFSKSAPHLVVNLLGETTFYQATADYCWYRARSSAPALSPDIVSALKARGAEKLSSKGVCGKAPAAVDIILLERGDFLQGDVVETGPIVEAFIDRKLRIVEALLWSELGEAKAKAQAESEKIRNDVMANARSGFGFVAVKSTAGTLCMIADGVRHQRAFIGMGEAFDRFRAANPKSAPKSLDQAFIGVQRDECSAIYAETGDMKRLIEGLDRAVISYSVPPFWIDTDRLAKADAALADKAGQEQQRIAALQQEQEARELQARSARENETARLAKLQAELRARYSQEAKAAFDGLSDRSEAYLVAANSNDGAFPLLFPALAEWKTEQFNAGWAPESYDDQLLDYGTAEWKGRRLEGVVVEVTTVLKHPIRGEYAKNCFVLGYLMDQEFGLQRDAFVEPCGATQWRDRLQGRAFESRWVAR